MQIFASTLVKFAKNVPYFRPIVPPPRVPPVPPPSASRVCRAGSFAPRTTAVFVVCYLMRQPETFLIKFRWGLGFLSATTTYY